MIIFNYLIVLMKWISKNYIHNSYVVQNDCNYIQISIITGELKWLIKIHYLQMKIRVKL